MSEASVESAHSLGTRWHLPAAFRILFLLAAGLGFAGQELSVVFLMNLAMVCFGLLLILLGLEEIITRLAAYQTEGWGSAQAIEKYQALASQLWGLIFAAMGLMIIVITLTNWFAPATGPGMWSDLLNGKTGAGLVLGTVGAMATLSGLIRVLGGGSTGANTGRLATLSGLLDRLGGSVTFVFGLAVTGVALILLMAPALVDAFLSQLAGMIAP